MTPEEAVRLGLEHSRLVGAARADAGAARAAFRQVQASRLPAVRVRGDYRRLVGDVPAPDIAIPGFDTTFAIFPIPRDQVHTEISLEQPLFQGGRLRNQARAAEHEAEAAGLLAEQEEADVALGVRSAYWELYRARSGMESVEAALTQMEAHVRDLENLFEEGVILRSELLAALTRRSEVRLDLVEANNAVRVAALELNRLIGLPLDAEVEPVPGADPQPLGGDPERLVQQALEDRPHLRALEERTRALERQVGVARGTWLPEVSLVARYTYARPNPLVLTEMDEFRGIGEAGILLSWSVFEGGRRPAQAAEAQSRLRAAEERLADAREQVDVNVQRRVLETVRADEALAVAREHAEQAEEAFRVISEQFEEGVVLSAQVLEAEQVHRAAQAGRAAAVAQQAVARAALLNALGQVW